MQSRLSAEQRGRRALWMAEISRAKRYLETGERNNAKAENISIAGVTEANKHEWLDLVWSFEACVEMSIISFCTLYNSGYGSSGGASKNDQGLIRKQLGPIEKAAFPDQNDHRRYIELRDRLKGLRDGILAHSSAVEHDVKHGPLGIIMSSSYGSGAWRDIDRTFFLFALNQLDAELMNSIS